MGGGTTKVGDPSFRSDERPLLTPDKIDVALDFDSIDRAIATGAPRQYSWLLAHGLIVTLVWLYIEFLRLLARLRDLPARAAYPRERLTRWP